MTLEEYYKIFDNIKFMSGEDVYSLQQELLSKLSQKDLDDFHAYTDGSYFDAEGKWHKVRERKTKPNIWKFIYSSLPLYALFTYADNKHLQRLYNKYKKGDSSVFKKLEEYVV